MIEIVYSKPLKIDTYPVYRYWPKTVFKQLYCVNLVHSIGRSIRLGVPPPLPPGGDQSIAQHLSCPRFPSEGHHKVDRWLSAVCVRVSRAPMDTLMIQNECFVTDELRLAQKSCSQLTQPVSCESVRGLSLTWGRGGGGGRTPTHGGGLRGATSKPTPALCLSSRATPE